MKSLEQDIVDFCNKGEENYKDVRLSYDGLKFGLQKKKKYKTLCWKRTDGFDYKEKAANVLAMGNQLGILGRDNVVKRREIKTNHKKIKTLMDDVARVSRGCYSQDSTNSLNSGSKK